MQYKRMAAEEKKQETEQKARKTVIDHKKMFLRNGQLKEERTFQAPKTARNLSKKSLVGESSHEESREKTEYSSSFDQKAKKNLNTLLWQQK